MKVTLGSSLGMTITNIPYSPIKVETTLLIERTIGDDITDEQLEEFIQVNNEKIEGILYKELNKKMSDMAVEQKKLKKKLESMV